MTDTLIAELTTRIADLRAQLDATRADRAAYFKEAAELGNQLAALRGAEHDAGAYAARVLGTLTGDPTDDLNALSDGMRAIAYGRPYPGETATR